MSVFKMAGIGNPFWPRLAICNLAYQNRPFFASDDVIVLVPKAPLTPAAAHFVCALIRAERFRFSYGRKWNMERMKQAVLRLPITSEGDPDWTLMERFIEALPYSSSIGLVS